MTVIMSGEYSELVSAMEERGNNVIPTKCVSCIYA